MVSCEKYLKDFILFDINMCSNLMEQILSTTYKIRNELHRLKVSFLSQKSGPRTRTKKNWIKKMWTTVRITDPNEKPRIENCGPQSMDQNGKIRTKKCGPQTGPKILF